MLALANFALNDVCDVVLASEQKLWIWGKKCKSGGSERGAVKMTFSIVNVRAQQWFLSKWNNCDGHLIEIVQFGL